MPTRNSRKTYVKDGYYHVYSRGADKKPIFMFPEDYEFFLSLFKRYLSNEQQFSKARVAYPNFSEDIKLLSYCLMPNHIHLMIYLDEEGGLKKFMQSVMTSYSMYFNQKYGHFGPVFQSRFLASLIDKDNYLLHISRYIHLNPKNYKRYPYSSLKYYNKQAHPDWLSIDPVLSLFRDVLEYQTFLEDYEDYKASLDELKYELASE